MIRIAYNYNEKREDYSSKTFTRTKNSDTILFEKSFRFSLEMLDRKNEMADFTAASYRCEFESAIDNCKKMNKEAAMLLLKVSNMLYLPLIISKNTDYEDKKKY